MGNRNRKGIRIKEELEKANAAAAGPADVAQLSLALASLRLAQHHGPTPSHAWLSWPN